MDIPVLDFKHMFRPTLLNETEYQTLVQYFRGISNNKPSSGRALFVLVVRSPCEWADAMRRKPWHLCPTQPFVAHPHNHQNNQGNNNNEYTEDELCHGSPYISMEAQPETQALSLHDFARQPWREWAIHNTHYLHDHKRQSFHPNYLVRPHHTPGDYSPPFDHIFHLRTFKLQLMAQVIQAAQEAVTSFHPQQQQIIALPIVLIHLRDFEAAPHRTIVEMA